MGRNPKLVSRKAKKMIACTRCNRPVCIGWTYIKLGTQITHKTEQECSMAPTIEQYQVNPLLYEKRETVVKQGRSFGKALQQEEIIKKAVKPLFRISWCEKCQDTKVTRYTESGETVECNCKKEG